MLIFNKECLDPNCPALRRPVLPLGRFMATHIVAFHGGDKIVPVVDIDPDGSVGEACIDRMMKLMDDLEAMGEKMYYTSAKYRKIFAAMQAECEYDIQQMSMKAADEIGADSLG